jgi:hypothetical protein
MAIPAVKPAYGSTKFRTPIPTSAMIHTGITNNCQTCHEKNYLWQGVSNYPISPTTMVANAQYRGFQTRPFATATTYSVADAGHEASGLGVGTDCVLCHVGFNAFTGEGKPAGHMPTAPAGNPACTICHTTPGDYRTNGGLGTSTALHGTMVSTFMKYTAATVGSKSCANCHAVGTGGISGTAPFVQCTAASQSACPSPLPQTYQPKTVAGVSTRTHLPIKTLDCNGCHSGVTAFAPLSMKSGTNAASMHSNATLAGIKCLDCHENGMATMWDIGSDTLKTRTPSKHTTAARMAPNDCNSSGCHSFNGGFRAVVRPVMREAMISPELGRVKPSGVGGIATRGALGNSFDHQGVEPAKCKTCHDGKKASGMPPRHLMVMASCDTCHSTSAWTPAQFSHGGITPNTCLACHNGMGASRKPSGHFMTGRSCDSCHKTTGWSPVAYTHTSPSYKPGSEPAACITCHVTNSEIIPRQMRALNRVKPVVGN